MRQTVKNFVAQSRKYWDHLTDWFSVGGGLTLLWGTWLLVLGGCAHGRFALSPPLEQSPPNDVIWASTGVVLDVGLQVAKVKPLPRVLLVVASGVFVRYSPTFKRPVDSGVLFVWGAGLSEIVGFVLCRGPCSR